MNDLSASVLLTNRSALVRQGEKIGTKLLQFCLYFFSNLNLIVKLLRCAFGGAIRPILLLVQIYSEPPCWTTASLMRGFFLPLGAINFPLGKLNGQIG